MRISTGQFIQQGISQILAQQQRLAETQEQLATGRRVVRPSDDPAAATRALTLRESISTLQQYDDNINLVTSRLQIEEAALISAGDFLQRARELAIQANNATQTNETRAGIVVELQGIVEGLLSAANTRDSNNEYIFAGFRTSAPPFVTTGNGFSYIGDQGVREVQIGASRQVAIGDSGAAVFFDIANGNGTFATSASATNTGNGVIDNGSVTDISSYIADTYTVTFTTASAYEVTNSSGATVATGTQANGQSIEFLGIQAVVTGQPATGDTFTFAPSTSQDVFTTIQNLVNSLNATVTDPSSQADINNGVNAALANIDQALDNILLTRSSIGTRLNAVDDQTNLNGIFQLEAQTSLSGIEDIDIAEVISRFNQQLVSLQAAQQAFVQVQRLSLLNFL
ncbi:MAG: flagellar hook-associated protein FlgL [Gammaproteobacteria bacterium]|nr:flagellar hook-associated protein FlgL [Gammaproteobacteria bacterium]